MEKDHLILEICVDSLVSAIVAEEAGADRIELCEALDLGGLTPSAGLIAMVKQEVKIPIYMMVRPRCGNFNYTTEESMQMVKDIEFGLTMGVDGFVLGALSENWDTLDKPLCLQMIQAAQGKPVTFHRAFDMMEGELEQTLNDVIELGFTRILTSGRAHSAVNGIENITKLIELAGSRIIIMPGAGLDGSNIKNLAKATHAKEFHASGRFNKYERYEEPPVVEGADLYKSADSFIIKSMRDYLDEANL